MQHPFTDWLEVLTDRRAPLAVSPATTPTGATGQCYSVESTSASLNAPLDVGIYCYRPDGTPTAVRADFGTLRLAGEPGPRRPPCNSLGRWWTATRSVAPGRPRPTPRARERPDPG
ncbi:hypothetical protein [Micromonospora sp. ATA51]|uniref:hypothetical protein n=1 Tax=Micromonospora sp. ATA51 TaxID=2806098 RepID=UPI001EE4D7A7|nr:hypothetical protein [Micromonospora sp. ATA51]